jgi:hypothetical protein
MLLLIIACIFLAGAIHNLCIGDFREMAGGLFITIALVAVYFSRRKKAARDAATISAQDSAPLHCCKCGSCAGVEQRAYLITYSLIFFTSKSSGELKPICKGCRVKAGLPYSLCTLLLGWWGIPWGPVRTIESIYRNFQGGITVPSAEKDV